MSSSRGRASFQDHRGQPLGVGTGGFSTKLPKRRGGSGPHVLQNLMVGALFVFLFVALSTADLLVRVIVVRRQGYSHVRTSEGGGVWKRGNSAQASRSEIDEPFPGIISEALRLRELEVKEEQEAQLDSAATVVWTEPRIQPVWQGPPLEQFLDQKTEAAVKEMEETLRADQLFQLHIQVDARCEEQSLNGCLSALREATYGGDRIHLTVSVNCSHLPDFVKDLQWPHGSKRVFQSGESEHSAPDPLALWWPVSDSHHLFLLPATARISPGFYLVLKETALSMGGSGGEGGGRSLLAAKKDVPKGGGIESRKAAANSSEPERPQVPVPPSSLFGLSLDHQAPPLARGGSPGGVQGGACLPGGGGVGKGGFLSPVLGSGCQLLFPRPWRKFWEWHRETQVPQVSTTKLKFDAEAYDFSSTCRADWVASAVTYMSERSLFNLYVAEMEGGRSLCITHPGAKSRLVEPGSTPPTPVPLQSLPLLPKFDFCGRRVRGGAIASNVEQLRAFLGPLARRGRLVGVMVSPGYDDMLANWLCYVKELSLRNFFIITQDRQQALRLSGRGLSVYNAAADLPQETAAGGGGEAQPLDYGSIEYKKFILARTKAIGEILHAGYDVLLADVDAVWFSDPFEHMKEEGVDVFAQLEEHGNPCGGFLFLVHTKVVMRMWDAISVLFEEHIQWLETHPSRKSPKEYATFLESQKHSHEQKYLHDFLHGGKANVKLKGLDPLLFINGRDYFDRKYAQHAGIVPVMIHNNYIVGKESKVRRFEIKGMWRVEGSSEHKTSAPTATCPLLIGAQLSLPLACFLAALTCKCLTLSCADTSAPWASLNVTLPERERINFKRRYGQRTAAASPPPHLELAIAVASKVKSVGGGARERVKKRPSAGEGKERMEIVKVVGSAGHVNGTGSGRSGGKGVRQMRVGGAVPRNSIVVGKGGGAKRSLLSILERIQRG